MTKESSPSVLPEARFRYQAIPAATGFRSIKVHVASSDSSSRIATALLEKCAVRLILAIGQPGQWLSEGNGYQQDSRMPESSHLTFPLQARQPSVQRRSEGLMIKMLPGTVAVLLSSAFTVSSASTGFDRCREGSQTRSEGPLAAGCPRVSSSHRHEWSRPCSRCSSTVRQHDVWGSSCRSRSTSAVSR